MDRERDSYVKTNGFLRNFVTIFVFSGLKWLVMNLLQSLETATTTMRPFHRLRSARHNHKPNRRHVTTSSRVGAFAYISTKDLARPRDSGLSGDQLKIEARLWILFYNGVPHSNQTLQKLKIAVNNTFLAQHDAITSLKLHERHAPKANRTTQRRSSGWYCDGPSHYVS
jgi:hypothetical protein